jgi:hypothetical protein
MALPLFFSLATQGEEKKTLYNNNKNSVYMYKKENRMACYGKYSAHLCIGEPLVMNNWVGSI